MLHLSSIFQYFFHFGRQYPIFFVLLLSSDVFVQFLLWFSLEYFLFGHVASYLMFLGTLQAFSHVCQYLFSKLRVFCLVSLSQSSDQWQFLLWAFYEHTWQTFFTVLILLVIMKALSFLLVVLGASHVHFLLGVLLVNNFAMKIFLQVSILN